MHDIHHREFRNSILIPDCVMGMINNEIIGSVEMIYNKELKKF